jgi:AcrR family transcriptional regulator
LATPGRRPKPSDARGDILAAARAQFAERGFSEATLRSIADAAQVHPALIHHYFGTKEQLYNAALSLPVDPIDVVTELARIPRDEFPEALVRHFVATWRDSNAGPILHAKLRRAFADPNPLALLRTLADSVDVPRIAAAFGLPALNVAAAFEMLHGLMIGDTIIRVEPLAHATDEEIVAVVTPAITRCLGLSEVDPNPRSTTA